MDSIGCKAIVITGEGKFSRRCRYQGVSEVYHDGDSVELIELTDILHPMLVKMRTSKTLRRSAKWGIRRRWLGLALACDARIASPNGKMAASIQNRSSRWWNNLVTSTLGWRTDCPSFLPENQVWSAEKHANSAPTKWFLNTI